MEEEIQTLSQVLAAKEKHLAEIKRKLGINSLQELKQNIARGWQDVTATPAYVPSLARLCGVKGCSGSSCRGRGRGRRRMRTLPRLFFVPHRVLPAPFSSGSASLCLWSSRQCWGMERRAASRESKKHNFSSRNVAYRLARHVHVSVRCQCHPT